MMDDMELVREFAVTNSQRAFEALVSRHINLVYSAALRQVLDPHLAEEIAPAVFIILARKAGSLDSRTALSGWLYRTARYVSADAIKMQRRRQIHEQEAYMQSTLTEGQTETIWERMLPVLDEAMAQLRDKERDAVVLRFFENKSLREVGEALGLEERTAQKRIHRAVDKLRNYLGKRGVVATTTIITGLVSANSVQAAPITLSKTISIAVMGKGAAVGTFSLNLADKALGLIAWNKAKAAILVCAAVVISCGSALLGFNHLNSFANEDATAWTSERLDLVAPQLILRPAKNQTEASFSQSTLLRNSALDANFSNQPRVVFTVLTAEGNRDRVIRPVNLRSGVGQFSFGGEFGDKSNPSPL